MRAWLPRPINAPLQRVSLELFTHEAAGELVEWFHAATPWPGDAAAASGAGRANDKVLLAAGASLGGAVAVIVVLILVALARGTT